MIAPGALSLLAEPRREALVQALWAGERSAGQFNDALPEITFGAVSQHLAKLRAAGLVSARREGRRRIYRVERAAFGPLAQALDAMWATHLTRLQHLAEGEARSRRSHR